MRSHGEDLVRSFEDEKSVIKRITCDRLGEGCIIWLEQLGFNDPIPPNVNHAISGVEGG